MNRCGLLMAVLLVAGAAVAAAQDVDSDYQALQDAVAKKDVATIKKLAAETSAMARQEIAKPGETDPDLAKKRLEDLHAIDTYTEYALYATAVQSEAPVMVDLIATLEKQNPKSKYLNLGYGPYLAALAKTGATAKIPETAEKALANFPENPYLLDPLARNAASHGQNDRTVAYSTRIIALWNSHPKPPEVVSEAEWNRERDATLGPSYYMAGMAYAATSHWVDADKNLRAALSYVKGNPTTYANALFQLGIANYNLGKMTMNKAKVLEGAKFSKEAAAIQSNVQQQAWKNAQVMEAEAARMR
jgi:tetratricopeptide (TPR) repeat protein